MNLGVVLLPLRVFLGFISIYAGMGKLCDPVYFDGGKRGSMVKWLNSLHPWELAEPLRQFALQHPVGAGLVIAFLQVIVGVLTVLGLWQRVAAVVGALLSAALLVTVSWKTVPAYDAPDIIYLAAWSPLIIAGAPVYSIDGRLAGEAWRTLGPRADIWELRRRVLRRGALVATVVVGLTLLIGSLLGGAVRDADRVIVPGPGEAPRNELPGSPLPKEPGERRHKREPLGVQLAHPGRYLGEPHAGARDHAGRDARDRGRTAPGSPARRRAPRPGPAPAVGPAAGPQHHRRPDLLGRYHRRDGLGRRQRLRRQHERRRQRLGRRLRRRRRLVGRPAAAEQKPVRRILYGRRWGPAQFSVPGPSRRTCARSHERGSVLNGPVPPAPWPPR